MPWGESPRRAPCSSRGDQVWAAARCQGAFRTRLNPVTQWPNPAWFQAQRAASCRGYPPPGRAQLGVAVLSWVLGAGSRREGPRALQARTRPGSQTSGLFKGRQHREASGAAKAEQTAAQPPALSHEADKMGGWGSGHKLRMGPSQLRAEEAEGLGKAMPPSLQQWCCLSEKSRTFQKTM